MILLGLILLIVGLFTGARGATCAFYFSYPSWLTMHIRPLAWVGGVLILIGLVLWVAAVPGPTGAHWY